MIKYYYKDIGGLADIFVFNDGKRLVIPWAKYDRIRNKYPELYGPLFNTPGGMDILAARFVHIILEYGEKI